MGNAARATRITSPIGAMVSNTGAITNMIMDADGEELAIKYYPPTTSPITAINWFLTVVGTGSSVTLATRVESDSSDAPSGSVLGSASSGFSGPASSNWTTAQSLASNTGTLTLNTPVWVILARTGGSSLSGSLSFQLNGTTNVNSLATGDVERLFTAASWTGTAVQQVIARVVITHADGTISGNPSTGNQGNPAGVTAIYSTNRQGLRFKAGAQVKIFGVMIELTKTGSPSALEVLVYESTTSQYGTQSVPAASIVTNRATPIFFSSPIFLAANTNLYVVFRQASNGGDASNNYTFRGMPMTSADIDAIMAPDTRFVSGTGDDPTALTVSTTFAPRLFPLVDDTATDIYAPGGGLIVHPGYGGGTH